MKNHPPCPFQKEFMKSPCNRKMLKNHNEWVCIIHGTMHFENEAWDAVETPSDTYEAENGGSSWSQEETALLLQLDESGVSISRIASKLSRTRNAIYYKLWSLKERG